MVQTDDASKRSQTDPPLHGEANRRPPFVSLWREGKFRLFCLTRFSMRSKSPNLYKACSRRTESQIYEWRAMRDREIESYMYSVISSYMGNLSTSMTRFPVIVWDKMKRMRICSSRSIHRATHSLPLLNIHFMMNSLQNLSLFLLLMTGLLMVWELPLTDGWLVDSLCPIKPHPMSFMWTPRQWREQTITLWICY